MDEEKDVFNEETFEKGYKSALERLRAKQRGEDIEPTVVLEEEPVVEEPEEVEPEEEVGFTPHELFRMANQNATIVDPADVVDQEDVKEEEDENDGPVDFEDLLDNLDMANASSAVEPIRSIAGAAKMLTGDAQVDASYVSTSDLTISNENGNTLTEKTYESTQYAKNEDQVQELVESESVIEFTKPATVVQVEQPEAQTEAPEQPQQNSVAAMMMRAHQQHTRQSVLKVSTPTPKQETEEEKYERLARENGYDSED